MITVPAIIILAFIAALVSAGCIGHRLDDARTPAAAITTLICSIAILAFILGPALFP